MVSQFTPAVQQEVKTLAQKYALSENAVMTLVQALITGHYTMAQFDHPELGGNGQWMQGGMTMIGDMFNQSLKATVEGLCTELSLFLSNQSTVIQPTATGKPSQPVSQSSTDWWPNDLGTPSATGAQNQMRYAYFAQNKRLALEVNGQISIYDTLDHQISGVSQQQGTQETLAFTSQRGTFGISDLPCLSGTQKSSTTSPKPDQKTDTAKQIKRLTELKQKGILSEKEFATQKRKLLPESD